MRPSAKRVFGTSERPRLCVYRSLKHTYGQIINDEEQKTLVAVSTLSPEIRDKIKGLKKVEQSKIVGENLALKAISLGIKKVCFDRNNRKYHGRVKALAEGAREKGLEF